MPEPQIRAPLDEEPKSRALIWLERGDEFAHYLLATLLLTAALIVVVAGTYHLGHSILFSTKLPEEATDLALTYLSDLLFALILLEILSTLLTYVKSKRLESTIRDFLIVGMISLVRKILLVGAQSALARSPTDDFVKESEGTTMTIIGILLLIVGLLLLEGRNILIRRAVGETASKETGQE